MKVKYKKLNPNAVEPHKAHSDDFCYDVVAISEEEIAPNVWKYGLGLAFEIVRPYGNTNLTLAIDFRARSSVWKTGMVLSNCIGTVDEGYRGEVSAIFFHVMPDMPRYKVGDRIGQIVLNCAAPMELELSESLGVTNRGSHGFGSTGIK